ncbi:chitobiase/beta-hexosaminidase C-terminal domain-containing protein [Streptomyces sp. TLI_171]|uniref:chitobiase/beta-hexosaminidase C-terminal domain-containing protein n=1 Tax=Streptomyces sp. TLI_171 TaxID=1938859 RepID=UPI00217EB45A|nr:chitobiase/beta-hexosaminidase C-terminal domain-containing protein [Streptomyces sp. TLI_171]
MTLSDATAGASIRYTTDGSTPTASSALYSTAITVSSTTTVKAIGIKSGLTNSAVASATYTIGSTGGRVRPSPTPPTSGRTSTSTTRACPAPPSRPNWTPSSPP